MDFYEALSKYYDKLFLPNKNIVEMINNFNLKNKSVLDLGAGTGTTSLLLHNAGYKMSSLELDHSMVKKINEKVKHLETEIEVIEGNMLNIDTYFKSPFELILCIGNTLPHLNSLKDVEILIQKSSNLMNNGGVLLLQIVNFDKLKNDAMFEFPTLTSQDKEVSFTRFYKINENNSITFNGRIQTDTEVLTSQVNLLKISSDELINICKKHFTSVEAFGDFKLSKYLPEESSALILKCVK